MNVGEPMKDFGSLLNKIVSEESTILTPNDAILYALSLGLGTKDQHLQFVYEKNLAVLPGMAMVLAYPGFWISEPEYGFDWTQVLHAEESIELKEKIPLNQTLIGKTSIENIVDRGDGKGSFIYTKKVLSLKESAKPVAIVYSNTLARADGGWAQKDSFKNRPNFIKTSSPPNREPDFIDNVETLPQSALLYRLCGDMNPLHADPEVAKKAGFNRPILHGRCTMGIAIVSLISNCCNYDATKLTQISVRFSSPFLPGASLSTRIWHEQNNLYFESFDLESGAKVLSNGYASLTDSKKAN